MKYSVACIVVLLFIKCADKNEGKASPEKKSATAAYALATVDKTGIATTIKLPAQLAAYEQVSIFPKVNAYVEKVLVDIGSRVSKGTLLMILQAPELLQAVAQAKERYVRSKADFLIDKEHYQRFLEASETAGAISPLDLSTLKGKMEADSAMSNAEKVNWQMQQTMLGYLKVTAPFSGVITERNVSPGALVSAADKSRPMLELKEISHLRLQVDIPEAVAGSIKEKDTVSFYAGSMPGKKMHGIINRQSMNVNAQYRSERTEIDVENKDELLSPGMYADVILYSKGSLNALSVPKSSVITSTEKKYVLVVRNGKIIKTEVTTGNQNASMIEVYGALQAGDKVIINGNDEIKESS